MTVRVSPSREEAGTLPWPVEGSRSEAETEDGRVHVGKRLRMGRVVGGCEGQADAGVGAVRRCKKKESIDTNRSQSPSCVGKEGVWVVGGRQSLEGCKVGKEGEYKKKRKTVALMCRGECSWGDYVWGFRCVKAGKQMLGGRGQEVMQGQKRTVFE